MDLLVVGTLAFDSVQTPFGKRQEILGGSGSYLATAASYFCPVQLVGIVGSDFPDRHLEFFRGREIDTSGVEKIEGRTFRWSGVYSRDMNERTTLETQLNVLEQFRPRLPESYRTTEHVVLGNFDPDLQLSVLEQLHHPRVVACDTMNFWIEGYRQALQRTLARVDILLVNDSEARMLSGEHNLVKAARAIRAMGPATVVIKLGEHGALLFDETGVFSAAAFPLEEVMDPTGAGDTFAGGMMGFLALRNRGDDASLRHAMAMGTVMASFSVEDFSIDRLRSLSRDEIESRFQQFRTLTQLESDGGPWADA